MPQFQKLVLSSIPASFLLFSLLAFAGCSSHEQKHTTTTHKSLKHNATEVSHQMTFDIKLHGILLWASMGFLMPLGILTIRMSNKEECGQTRLKLLFYFHAIVQMLTVFLGTAGAILSFKSFENSFNNSHQRVGLALYAAIWVQAVTGFRRPTRGSKGRSFWYIFHWIFGTTVSMVGIFNTYTGLKAYHKRTSKSIGLWTILFTAEVSMMIFFYLLQDKWAYMKKEGVILGNEPNPNTPSDQVLPIRDTQMEVLNEPCGKSNSLGSYFARTNALRKLFQLT